MNMSEWKKNFDAFLQMKVPNVSNYQYIDDYISDTMNFYRMECRVKKETPNWYLKRLYRHEAIRKAEAIGLIWRFPENERQYLLEKENME